MNEPFFVLSSGRSGSTLLASMLNMHSRIYIPVELFGLYSYLPRRLPWYGDLDREINLWRLALDLRHVGHMRQIDEGFDPDLFVSLMKEKCKCYSSVIQAFYEVLCEVSGKPVVGDKTPNNMPYFRLISETFPESRFVHLVRDGRDCAISSMKWREGVQFRNLYELASSWCRTNLAMAGFGKENPGRYLLLRYEDLIQDPEMELGRVCEFLGEGFERAMLEFSGGGFARKNAEALGHHGNLGRGLLRENKGKWKAKMSDGEVMLHDALAGSALAEFGYPVRSGARGVRWRVSLLGGWGVTTGRRVLRKLRGSWLEGKFRALLFVKRMLGVVRLRELFVRKPSAVR